MAKYKLYIKESPLGLKYLGKTERDPFKYIGSGLYWKRHLRSHQFISKDILTIVLFETDSKEELKNVGIYYSDLYDVVHDESWANLRKESGDGGDTSKFIDWEKYNRVSRPRGDNHWTKNMTEEQRENMSKKVKGDKNPACREEIKEKIRQKAIGRKPKPETLEKYKQRTGDKNGFYNKHHSEQTMKHLKEKAKGRYSLEWFKHRHGETEGTIKYEERRVMLKESMANMKPMERTELVCPHCKLVGKGPNMKRYHFDNCKTLKR
jgi:hypothetical protein